MRSQVRSMMNSQIVKGVQLCIRLPAARYRNCDVGNLEAHRGKLMHSASKSYRTHFELTVFLTVSK